MPEPSDGLENSHWVQQTERAGAAVNRGRGPFAFPSSLAPRRTPFPRCAGPPGCACVGAAEIKSSFPGKVRSVDRTE